MASFRNAEQPVGSAYSHRGWQRKRVSKGSAKVPNAFDPSEQLGRMARFDLAKVRRAMEKKAKAMPNSQCTKGRLEFVHAT
jgi:hypothetical protein